MALVTSIVGGVATLGGAALQSKAAKDAARAQGQAADAAVGEQRRQFDTIREDQQPWQKTGVNALNMLAQITGVPQYTAPQKKPTYSEWFNQNAETAGTAGSQDSIGAYNNYLTTWKPETAPAAAGAPDFSAFYKTPDYQFALDEGNQAIERSAAARGGLATGNTLAAIAKYGQGLATQNFGNYVNRLTNIAGVGQTANNTLANAGMQTAGNVGNALMAGGNARASGITDSANAWGGAINDLGGIAGYYMAGRKKPNILRPTTVGTGPY